MLTGAGWAVNKIGRRYLGVPEQFGRSVARVMRVCKTLDIPIQGRKHIQNALANIATLSRVVNCTVGK